MGRNIIRNIPGDGTVVLVVLLRLQRVWAPLGHSRRTVDINPKQHDKVKEMNVYGEMSV